jgi:phosphotransferase system enzyme I (PtsP)
MGGRPLEALALIALGIDRLSITPASVGPVKAMVRSTPLAEAKEKLAQLLAEPPTDLRGAWREWAQSRAIDLGL